ncbi:MAG: riboflavin synthase subunit alpha [Candidatus Berkiella sp.]
MFTGIIKAMAKIAWVSHTSALTRYKIALPPEILVDLETGASISVNGVCQTVVSIENQTILFEAIEDTLKRTSLAQLSVGQKVNIERSMKMGDEIGGHLLSGHVMGTARITNMRSPTPEQRVFEITCDKRWMRFILHKGYIALNGVSLTVGDVFPERGAFTVNLIPETLKLTTFGEAVEGDLINIEIDSQTQAIVETVERVLGSISP